MHGGDAAVEFQDLVRDGRLVQIGVEDGGGRERESGRSGRGRGGERRAEGEMSGRVLGVDGEALEHDEVHVEPFVDALGAVGEFLELRGGVVE